MVYSVGRVWNNSNICCINKCIATYFHRSKYNEVCFQHIDVAWQCAMAKRVRSGQRANIRLPVCCKTEYDFSNMTTYTYTCLRRRKYRFRMKHFAYFANTFCNTRKAYRLFFLPTRHRSTRHRSTRHRSNWHAYTTYYHMIDRIAWWRVLVCMWEGSAFKWVFVFNHVIIFS
jgi:hypothetical protein